MKIYTLLFHSWIMFNGNPCIMGKFYMKTTVDVIVLLRLLVSLTKFHSQFELQIKIINSFLETRLNIIHHELILRSLELDNILNFWLLLSEIAWNYRKFSRIQFRFMKFSCSSKICHLRHFSDKTKITRNISSTLFHKT